ncbi:MAG TPA: ankyrin repeat domain-containing protein, partial [Spirochaetota bacterium]|nr:ankyrin repeat domain-containing protein [Spirochaetota bacterium]
MRKIFVVILVLSMFCLNLFSGVNENLIFACNGFSDNPTKVKELIEKGANPEFLDKLTKKTSLMLAAGKGFVKIITELSNNSVDIDKQDEKGNTALIYACIAGKPEAVKSLISLKADVDLLNKDGETPLISLVKKSMATEKIKIDIISQLVAAGCDVNLKDKNDENAFLVESGKAIPNDKIVEKLIEVKSDLNLICKRTGDTALIMYIKVPFKIEMTKKLVKAGADVNMRGKNGITPLNCVIDSAYGDQRYIIPTLKVLIEDGKADINAMDDFGNALHYAAHETFINPTPRNEIGAYLISKGIDINARNNIYGTTPLMDLFRKSELDSYDFSLFKILLENKANIRLFDNNGNLVFNYAKNFEDDIYNLFEQIVKVYNPDYVSYKESILKRDDVGYAKENGKIKFTFKPENYRNIPDGIKSVKAVFFTTRKSPEYSE